LSLAVFLLAFLSASFVARNSDLWFHLATGRLVAQGHFSFGTDPFAYTTGSAYWVCHAWLFDLGLYALYELAGGTALVVLKAVLVAALAGLLLRVRRCGAGVGLPALCTSLAVVAMSPRLLVQPTCVSYFLLGLTFWLLWRPYAQKDELSARPTHVVLLFVFALWVNIDEWFFLGPLLVALFWLGERLGGQRQTPAWLVPAGLAACLLNPHTFHAFTLPPELSAVPWTSGLRQDVRFQGLFASPWQLGYLSTPAGLAYLTLTLLGLASFVVSWQALRGWRLVVWLPFALLAAWQARAIPFFAVVAAPITALNWQDALSTKAPVPRTTPRFVPGLAYGLLLSALLALSLLTWPGWLAGSSRQGRHVAWDLQADPSLEQAAETLSDWRRQGLLAAGERVFAVSAEVAQYGAWFCPGEKHFFDHRFALFPDTAKDYETVCRALLPGLAPDEHEAGSEPRDDWRQVLRKHGVGVVVFHDREPQRLFAVLRRLAGDPAHWTLLHVAGQVVIAGWNEARPPGAFAPLAFNPERLAYGSQDERARLDLGPAPMQGPEHLPPRRDWWARLARPPAVSSWESAAATMYLHYFDDSAAAQDRRQRREALGACAASLAGLPALPAALPQVLFELASSHQVLFPPRARQAFIVREQLGPFFAELAQRPPALPLLAVRAARRAVAASPEDTSAWLRLGQAYLLLRDVTCERSAEGLLPPLAELRHVQIVTALEQAVRLDPDLEAAHRELAFLYGQRQYFDQALEHRREEVRLARRAGPRPGEKAEEWADRMELLEKDTAKLEELVRSRRKAYAAAAGALQGERLAQAGLALKLGLARQALEEILLPAPADLLGTPGIKLELELLLALGRVEEVRAILGDEGLRSHKQGLGYYDVAPPRRPDGSLLYPLPYHWPAYDWLVVLQAAAVGDYAQAQEALHVLRAGLHTGHTLLRQQVQDLERRAAPLAVELLAGPPPFLVAFRAYTLGQLLDRTGNLRVGEPILRAQEADLWVLDGLLALEQGSPATARSAFDEAHPLSAQSAGSVVPFAGQPIAGRYLALLRSYAQKAP
jgi:hypothetical protein